MATNVFHDVYAGKREPKRTLVTIDRDASASYAEYPLNYRCPWTVTSVVHNLYATSMSLVEEAAEYAAHLRLRGFPDLRTTDSMRDMAREIFALGGKALAGLSPVALPEWPEPLSGTGARGLADDLPRYFTSTINLKQFRDPQEPEHAAYTALVESAMGVERVNQIGLLGDWDLLRGDKSGGYSISISRYRAEPIIETLGIEVPNLYERAREGDVVTLRPSFPFWMDVDLYYGAGDVVCSRTPALDGGDWVEEWQADGARGRHRVGHRQARTPRPGVHHSAYNTALGAATLPITGPMRFPDLTAQVYPLLADADVLRRFVDWSWNRLFADGKLSLELAGAYVYLIVSTVGDAHGRMWSGTDNIGQWAEREVSFAIPVRWKLDGELVGLAMIEPLAFADKPRAVITYREVNGRNAYQADIESPPDAWLSPGGPGAPRKLVRVMTESFVGTRLRAGDQETADPRDRSARAACGWGLEPRLRRRVAAQGRRVARGAAGDRGRAGAGARSPGARGAAQPADAQAISRRLGVRPRLLPGRGADAAADRASSRAGRDWRARPHRAEPTRQLPHRRNLGAQGQPDALRRQRRRLVDAGAAVLPARSGRRGSRARRRHRRHASRGRLDG